MNAHTMNIMDPTGHTSVTWDPANSAEVDIARTAFTEMTAKGFYAFRVEKNGRQGARMTSFDPSAEEMLIVPHLVGG